VNSNPFDGAFAEMAGSRCDLDFVRTAMLDDWGRSVESKCGGDRHSCGTAAIAPNPCERSRRLWRHFLQVGGAQLDPDLPSFISINASKFVDYGVPPEWSEAVDFAKCALGPEYMFFGDTPGRRVERQQSLARHFSHELGVSAQAAGGLRLVSNAVMLALEQFCLREVLRLVGFADFMRCNNLGTFMGRLVATFLALHLCEETHLYGFYLSEHSPDLGDVPYSYYQPMSNGKRTLGGTFDHTVPRLRAG
jgi:hypothetical protein